MRGLKGCKTLNKDPDPKNPTEGEEDRLVCYLFARSILALLHIFLILISHVSCFKRPRDAVTFPGFVDCVYLDAPNELQFDNGLGDTLIIKSTKYVYRNTYVALCFHFQRLFCAS